MSAHLSHWDASALVAAWSHSTPVVANLFKHESLWDKSHRLEFVDDREPAGHTISVSFCAVKDHPEWMRVNSSNWRCEDEPNNIYPIIECRVFYRRLVAAGFEAF
jgi:hypothetical protein